MTKPDTWYCDVCSEQITQVKDGALIWRTTPPPDRKAFDYKIVHKITCDPGSQSGFVSQVDLKTCVGPDGLAMLLSWLSAGPLMGPSESGPDAKDMDEYVDLVRRLQTPWYEEARGRFDDETTREWLGDANEYYPYMPEVLQRTADGTLGQ